MADAEANARVGVNANANAKAYLPVIGPGSILTHIQPQQSEQQSSSSCSSGS